MYDLENEGKLIELQELTKYKLNIPTLKEAFKIFDNALEKVWANSRNLVLTQVQKTTGELYEQYANFCWEIMEKNAHKQFVWLHLSGLFDTAEKCQMCTPGMYSIWVKAIQAQNPGDSQ